MDKKRRAEFPYKAKQQIRPLEGGVELKETVCNDKRLLLIFVLATIGNLCLVVSCDRTKERRAWRFGQTPRISYVIIFFSGNQADGAVGDI